MAETRLTSNSDETTFGKLLQVRANFTIPPFQREYKWKPQRLVQLQDDIARLLDEEEDAHFMGALILDEVPTAPTATTTYEVIDGQQRLTTIYLLLSAIVHTLLKQKHVDEASEIALSQLFTREGTTRLNIRLIPSLPDHGDLNLVIDELWSSGLQDALKTYELSKLPSAAVNSAQITKNFKSLKSYTNSIYKADGLTGIQDLLRVVLESITVVQIVVKDPTSGPKIFDSLNSKQEPMTTGDLVRNEIFGKIAKTDPKRAQELDRDLWQPFFESFRREGNGNTFEGFFFPYGLITDPQFKKSQVYPELRKAWAKLTPQEVLSRLDSYRNEYQDLVFGENGSENSPKVAAAVLRLNRMNFTRAALPFLMQVVHGARLGQIDEETATDLLSSVESFLVRRALCSVEPTGLHAVFKRLWGQLKEDYTAQNVVKVISDAKTVKVPSDKEVKDSFVKPLYGKNIAKFFLFEHNASLGGDLIEGSFEALNIEHVLPDTHHEKNWNGFTREDHEALKHLAGNLIPLSKPMNSGVGQSPYLKKSDVYAEDSMFKSARSLKGIYPAWTPTEINSRTDQLAKWSVERWPFAK